MTQKHTPGPWSVKPSETMRGDIEIHIGAYQKFYVPLHATDLTFEDTKIREANAALIAAAPDLLEALKSVTTSFRAFGGFAVEESSAYNRALDIIAKAEGHTQ